MWSRGGHLLKEACLLLLFRDLVKFLIEDQQALSNASPTNFNDGALIVIATHHTSTGTPIAWVHQWETIGLPMSRKGKLSWVFP